MSGDGGGISGQPLRLTDVAGATEVSAEPPKSAGSPGSPGSPGSSGSPGEELAAARREFAVLLGEFRRTAVLVPLDAYGSLWTADQNGVRWICAFSDEAALARFARAQGDAGREWTYQMVLGARLLDVMVPLLKVPAGVALDAGGDEGMLFPPVEGIVPEGSAVVADDGGAV